MSIYSLQRLLSCFWSSGEPSNVIDVIVVRDEGRFINRCDVCERIGMGSPMSFLRDKRAIRPLHRQRAKSDVVQGCAQTLLNFASDGVTCVTDWLRSGLELVASSK